jgi:hypothetical protein
LVTISSAALKALAVLLVPESRYFTKIVGGSITVLSSVAAAGLSLASIAERARRSFWKERVVLQHPSYGFGEYSAG